MAYRYKNETGLTRSAFQEILDITNFFPEIEKVKLFGKRAEKNRTEKDIKDNSIAVDLALYGDFEVILLSKILFELKNRPFEQEFNLIHVDEKTFDDIEKNGIDISEFLDPWANTRYHQSGLSSIVQHGELPVFSSDEFNFFRAIQFSDGLYGKTVSELHEGNLRRNDNPNNRHSRFLDKYKISYWADSSEAAYKEVKRWGATDDLITFEAYDDASSTFPTISPREPLVIVDGIGLGFHKILDKIENEKVLTEDEERIISEIEFEDPDCLAYKSATTLGARNFLFFEKGFKKLAVRNVSLNVNGNSKMIVCASSSDYNAHPENYGKYFDKLFEVNMDERYLNSEEYRQRTKIKQYYSDQYRDSYNRKKKPSKFAWLKRLAKTIGH